LRRGGPGGVYIQVVCLKPRDRGWRRNFFSAFFFDQIGHARKNFPPKNPNARSIAKHSTALNCWFPCRPGPKIQKRPRGQARRDSQQNSFSKTIRDAVGTPRGSGALICACRGYPGTTTGLPGCAAFCRKLPMGGEGNFGPGVVAPGALRRRRRQSRICEQAHHLVTDPDSQEPHPSLWYARGGRCTLFDGVVCPIGCPPVFHFHSPRQVRRPSSFLIRLSGLQGRRPTVFLSRFAPSWIFFRPADNCSNQREVPAPRQPRPTHKVLRVARKGRRSNCLLSTF